MNDGPVVALARRGVRAAERRVPWLRRPIDFVRRAESPEVTKLRADLKRVRSKLKRAETERERLSTELRKTRESLRDPDPSIALPDAVAEVLATVRQRRLSFLHQPNLETLARVVLAAERDGRPGLLVECGAGRGGSAIVMAAAKDASRTLRVFDADLDTDVAEFFARVLAPVETIDVQLVGGPYAETITLEEPVAVAHLAGDEYPAVRTCLERIAPQLSLGGRIVVEDYYAKSGCTQAVDEFMAHFRGFRLERRATLHLVRVA